jgi:hypothetical protein
LAVTFFSSFCYCSVGQFVRGLSNGPLSVELPLGVSTGGEVGSQRRIAFLLLPQTVGISYSVHPVSWSYFADALVLVRRRRGRVGDRCEVCLMVPLTIWLASPVVSAVWACGGGFLSCISAAYLSAARPSSMWSAAACTRRGFPVPRSSSFPCLFLYFCSISLWKRVAVSLAAGCFRSVLASF